MIKERLHKSFDWLGLLLLFIMGIRIASYFTITDSLAIARVIKIGSRLIVTGLSFLLYIRIHSYFPKSNFEHQNRFSFAFYAAYLILGFLSFGWSGNLTISALQWFMVIESLVFVIFFYRLYLLCIHNNLIQYKMNQLLLWSITIITSVFLIGMFSMPETFYRGTHGGEVHRLGGFIINPNELGMLMVLGLGMLMYECFYHNRTFMKFIAGVLMTWALFETQSRSSLIGLALIGGLYLYLSPSIKLKLFAIAGSIAVFPYLLNNLIIKQGDLQEVLSMTGRLPFWKDLIADGFSKEPWLGYGFMRIAYFDKFDSLHAYAASMTHNTFLQVLINLGIIGFTIVMAQMIFQVKAIAYTTNDTMKILAISLLIPLVINSLTEFGIFGESNYGILFYQFVICFFFIHINTNNSKLV